MGKLGDSPIHIPAGIEGGLVVDNSIGTAGGALTGGALALGEAAQLRLISLGQ